MCDNAELIMAIENHPCLWDTNRKDYHNRELKDIAWEEVCSQVYFQWESLSEEQKNKKYMETKKKWTNLRDCYRRDFLNRMKICSTKGPKKYIYADHLSFLAPVLRIKTFSGFEQNNSDEEDDNSSSEKEKCDNTVRELLKMDNDYTADELLLATTAKRKNKQTDTKDLPTRVMRLVTQPREKQTAADDDDDDSKFLLSFRSDLRSMNKRQKVDFKIGMLRLLKNVYGFRNDSSGDGNSSEACNSEAQELVYVDTQTS